eukprot:TRINITY_DN89047_c0_g1_i1.p1 TRINITY_DN89047_c0_g1~~TRINITY_DN89047_c0_g1_i1.p1  ORF type:complete len:229 (-),score=33.96 TRINITY_DN89047_c0_g1_i1:553-1239(-)
MKRAAPEQLLAATAQKWPRRNPDEDRAKIADGDGRVYLNCPFQEKDEAKRLGARWEPSRRQWYVEKGLELSAFSRWLPKGSNFAGVMVSATTKADQPPAGTSAHTVSKPKLTLRIQERYLAAIEAGHKTVEGRVFQGSVRSLAPGDLISLSSGSRSVTVQVAEVIRFRSFSELLEVCGLQSCLPGCPSLDEGVRIYHSFPNYEQLAATNGVVAFKISMARGPVPRAGG